MIDRGTGVKSMIADRIKLFREQNGMTQAELARKLGVTRSGVNAWEMGVTVPSTQYIMELSLLFGVSTDVLLDMKATKTVSVDGLSDREIASILSVITCYKNRGSQELDS